ncbi:MAG: hypothetical protein ACI88H_003229 [Cocleimonas sp.]|jgi:hypothetical protein
MQIKSFKNISSVNLIILTKLMLTSLILITTLILSVANASTKKWPLFNKGEVRYLKMIKVYDISLYSPNTLTADNILNENISKCLKLDYAINLTEDKFRLATSKILKRQHSIEFLEKIKKPLDLLQSSMKSVKKGDIYSLCYNGKSQTMRLDLNNNNLIAIKSAELAKAYLGIWLSKNKPISTPLFRKLFDVNTQK